MQRAEAEGRDPDEELRQVVGETVIEGMIRGYGMGTEAASDRSVDEEQPNGVKRSRTDADGGP